MSTKITLLTTNDIHGRFLLKSGILDFSRLRTYKKSINNCYLFDAGDATQGTPFAIMKKGLYPIEIMNAVGYDGITIGNHEFDNITKDTEENELDEIIKKSKAPFISTNVFWQKDSQNYIESVYKKAGLVTGNGRYIVKKVNGKVLLVIGVSTPDISLNIPRMEGYIIKTKNEVVSLIRESINLAKKEYEKIDAVVLLAHLGLNSKGFSSKTLADGLSKEDNVVLIIDGHSHEKYVRKINDINIIQSECNAKYFGKVEIIFEDSGEIRVDAKVENQEVLNKFEQDAEVKKLLIHYQDEVNRVFGEIRAQNTNTTLWGGALDESKPYALKALNISRFVQTNLGELTSAALIHYIRSYNAKLFTENEYIVAGRNGGGVRSSIAFGSKITDNELFDVLPSHIDSKNESGFKVFRLTYFELVKVLKNSVSSLTLNKKTFLEAKDGRFLNTAGIKYELLCFKPTPGDPSGIISVGSEFWLTAGKKSNEVIKKMSEKETVLFVVDKYLSQGGDGYDCLKDIKPIYEETTPLYKILGEYIRYLSNGKHLYYGGVSKDVAYKCFDFIKPSPVNIKVVDENGERISNRIIVYSFCDEQGYKNYVPEYLSNEGFFTVTPPQGATTLCIGVVNDFGTKENNFLYGELFINSYFSIKESQLECQVRRHQSTLFGKRAWKLFKHTGASGKIFYSNYIAYFDKDNLECMLIVLNDKIYVKKNKTQEKFFPSKNVSYKGSDGSVLNLELPFPEIGLSYKTWGGAIYNSKLEKYDEGNCSELRGYISPTLQEYYDGELYAKNNNSQLIGVHIRSGDILDGIGFIYPDNKEFFMGFEKGGYEKLIYFSDDEYITEITGEQENFYFSAITNVIIKTNKSQYGPFGDIKGINNFSLKKQDFQIYAFRGWSSKPQSEWKYKVVNNLGVYYKPIS